MNHFSFYSTFHRCSHILGLIVVLVCWIGVFVNSSAISAQPGWDLAWSDEFEGTTLDTSKWVPIDWTTPYNNERQAYHPDQVTVSGGNLQLTAIDIPYGDKAYRSGKVESKWAKQYGRWEVRAKLPRTRGTWPAIWLLPDGHRYPWPSQGEIDIMEHRGDKPTITTSAFHWGPNSRGRKFLTEKQEISRSGCPVDFTDSFHTYAVEWDAKKLRFFVDDIHHYTIHDADTGGFLAGQTAPAEVQLNVAVGGDYVDDAQPDETSVWPQQMLVDYVRVYVRAVATPKNVSEGHLGKKRCAQTTAGDVTAW
jgi:beta-glucanase (GH16 family)